MNLKFLITFFYQRILHWLDKISRTPAFIFLKPYLYPIFLTFIATSFAFYGIYQYRSAAQVTQRQTQKVTFITQGSLQMLGKDIAQNKLFSYTKHRVDVSPSLSPVRIEGWGVFSTLDGRRYRVSDVELNNETVQNQLYQFGLRHGLKVKEGFNHATSSPYTAFLFQLFYLLVLVFLLVFVQKYMMSGLMKRNFKLKQKTSVSFDDIVGYDPVKLEFLEVLDQLQRRSQYSKHGINPPKGILLTGSPGVGKTMFAQALAHEFNASFFHATGADFAEIFVGTGAQRIRSLFKQASQEPSAIIFIDEFDALGSRDNQLMDQERLSTINQLLSEMDGLQARRSILVIAATNHPQKIDPALIRPGRFDRKIEIPLPDTHTRELLLGHYLKKFTVDPSFNVAAFAHSLIGFSPAQLKNIVEQAVQLAFRQTHQTASNFSFSSPEFQDLSAHPDLHLYASHFEEALEIILMGITPRQSHQDELHRVAVHELGHALMTYCLKKHSQVKKISIQGRGMALGYALHTPSVEGGLEDRLLLTESEMQASIAVYLGGRAAEEVILGEVSSGSGDDLEKATQLALKMVTHWGLGSFGLMTLRPDAYGQYSMEVQKEVQRILNTQYLVAKDIVTQNKFWFDAKVPLLLNQKSLYEKDLFPLSNNSNCI